MTFLHKPVSRRMTLDPRLGTREAGQVTTTLYPGNYIGFRKLGRRKEVKMSLDAIYAMALKAEAESVRKEKLATKRAKHGLKPLHPQQRVRRKGKL